MDDDGNPQYSRRLKDKGVRESQHRAQHTQAEYLPLKNVSDVFKTIKIYVNYNYGDIKVNFPSLKLAKDVAIDFNNGKQLADIATEAVDFILDTKVSFPDIVEVEGDVKVTFKGSDIALKEYLKNFGYDVEVYRDTMILELHNELAVHKKKRSSKSYTNI